MAIKHLEKFIKFIEDPNYIVMWNNGEDKHIILDNKVYEIKDELRVYFKDFKTKYIDLYNCISTDFLFLREEKDNDF